MLRAKTVLVAWTGVSVEISVVLWSRHRYVCVYMELECTRKWLIWVTRMQERCAQRFAQPPRVILCLYRGTQLPRFLPVNNFVEQSNRPDWSNHAGGGRSTPSQGLVNRDPRSTWSQSGETNPLAFERFRRCS